tara:strand:+ start:382 stop:825 length:444 start_codon:yes stop_codon:yes gene_type:complete
MRIILFFILFYFQINIAYSYDTYFLMLKNSKVNVRYGPSLKSPIKFIYKKKNLPIKIIDKKENFRKIIDHKNNGGWIHISQLKKSSSLIILKETILFEKKTKFSKPIAKLEKGRLLIIKKCILDWCKIKTENYEGWLKIKDVWGKKS